MKKNIDLLNGNILKSLTELVTALCRIYHIDPGPATIVGHRDVNSTDCPGKNLYRLLPQLRDDVELNLYAEKLKGTHLLKLKKYKTQKPEPFVTEPARFTYSPAYTGSITTQKGQPDRVVR